MRKSAYRVCGMVLAMAIAFGSSPVTTGNALAKTDETTKIKLAEDPQVAPDIKDPTDQTAPVVGDVPSDGALPPLGAGSLMLDKTSINAMAGKSVKITLTNIPGGTSTLSGVTFKSDNDAVAKASKIEYAADYTSVTCTVELVAAGTTVIRADAAGNTYSCDVRVVKAFGKTDFSMYRPTNFVSYFKKRAKKYAWYYDGEWGKPNKYGSTYRGIRIGKTVNDVIREYGDIELKKCSKKSDPFLYEKQFNSGKKLKVSKYTEFVYKSGKINYRLRIYFTSAGKVHGFIYLAGKSFDKISKADYKRGRRAGEKLI